MLLLLEDLHHANKYSGTLTYTKDMKKFKGLTFEAYMFNIDSSKFTEMYLQENRNVPTKGKYTILIYFFPIGDSLTVVHMVRNKKANSPLAFSRN